MKTSVKMCPEEVFEILLRCDAVCLDVDCTVVTGDGIDHLAEYHGMGPEVTALTNKAMDGHMDLYNSLESRLNIIKPTSEMIHEFNTKKSLQLTPGVEDLICLLRAHQKTTYLVSGGFTCLIRPVAQKLGIPHEHIFANKLKFYHDGSFAGFDGERPTSRSGGKRSVIEMLRERHDSIVMIGDGITDLEAYPPADSFIGFGGNVIREAVKSKAPWFVEDFQEIINVLVQ